MVASASELADVRTCDKTSQPGHVQKSLPDQAQEEKRWCVYSGQIRNKSAMLIKGTEMPSQPTA